jgi:hypothetical protein
MVVPFAALIALSLAQNASPGYLADQWQAVLPVHVGSVELPASPKLTSGRAWAEKAAQLAPSFLVDWDAARPRICRQALATTRSTPWRDHRM